MRGLLIDKDDTLIKIEPFWKEPIHQLAIRTVDDMGYANDQYLISMLEQAAGFSQGSLIPESIVVAGTNDDIFEKWKEISKENEIKALVFNSSHYKDIWLRRLSDLCYKYGKVEAYEELTPIFSILKKCGTEIGVVTSDSWDMTIHCIHSLGLDKYISAVFTADRYKPKPNPDVAQLFSDRYELEMENIVMVGDSQNDILFAHNSGIHGVQIDYGNKRNIFEYAEKKISSLKEVLDIFRL